MSDPFSSACLGLCEWTGCLGPNGSSRQVGSRRDSSRCGGSYSVSTWATGPFEGRHSKMDTSCMQFCTAKDYKIINEGTECVWSENAMQFSHYHHLADKPAAAQPITLSVYLWPVGS